MLYKLIYIFHADYSFLNVFRYITFRTIYATLTAFICFNASWVLDYPKIKKLQVGQYVRKNGPPDHQRKTGTPTMGGFFILIAVLLSVLLWMEIKCFMSGLS